MSGEVVVRLYGMFALKAGRDSVKISLNRCRKVREIVEGLLEELGFGKVKVEGNLEPYALILVDGKPADLDQLLCGGEEVSILPPAVGG